MSNTSAVLLSDAALIRFVPAANYYGTGGNITFRAWDQTTSFNGATNIDVSTNGGVTAYSINSETATVDVTPVNDAPVITNGPDTAALTETERRTDRPAAR